MFKKFQYSNLKRYHTLEASIFILSAYSTYLIAQGFEVYFFYFFPLQFECLLFYLFSRLTIYFSVYLFYCLERLFFVAFSKSSEISFFCNISNSKLSGIVSILFSGILMAHYLIPMMSQYNKKFIREFFEVSAFVMESIIFTFLVFANFFFISPSISFLNIPIFFKYHQLFYSFISDFHVLLFKKGFSLFHFKHEYSIKIILASIIGCLLGRFFNIMPLSFFIKLIRPSHPVPFRHQVC